MKNRFRLPSVGDVVVGGARTLGTALGTFTKAREQALRNPSFVSGLADTSRWKGGVMSNQEQAQMRAARNSWIYTGINFKSLDLSASKADVFFNPGGIEGEGEAAPNHPFMTMMRRPNPYMGRGLLWQYTHWWMDLSGNAYWFIAPGEGGLPGEIWPLPANNVDIEFTDDGKKIKRFVLKVAGLWFYLDPGYVCHFKYANPFDFFRGMSPLVAAMLSVDIDLAMKFWNGQFFGNDNVMPSAIISLGSGDPNRPIDSKDIEVVKDELKTEYQAIKRKTVITNANSMSAAILGWNAKDMDFLAGLDKTKDEILWDLGIPPGMMDKSSTEANATVANKVFKDNMWGTKNIYGDEITVQILARWYKEGLEFRFEDDRVVDRKAELDEAEQAEAVMLIDEIRDKYWQLPALPDGRGARLIAEPSEQEMELENKRIDSKAKAEEDDPTQMNPDNAQPGKKKPVSTKSIVDELDVFRRKVHRAYKSKGKAAVKFSSDVLDATTIADITRDLEGVELKSDIEEIFAHWHSTFSEEGNTKGGKGSGHFGHAGRDEQNLEGGSLPGTKQSTTYYEVRGKKVWVVSKGQNLPDELVSELRQGNGITRIMYNVETKHWHIPAVRETHEVDHGDFLLQALEGKKPKYSEEVLGRGFYVLRDNEIDMYDFSEDVEYLTEDPLEQKKLSKTIEKVMRSASQNYFYLEGRKPVFSGMNFDEVNSGVGITKYIRAGVFRPWTGFELNLEAVILRALQAILELFIGRASENLDMDAGVWAQANELFRAAVAPIAADIAAKAAADAAARVTSTGISVSFDLTNIAARNWAEKYAAEQIANVSEVTRKAVRRAISDWVSEGRANGIAGLRERLEALTDETGVPLFGEIRAARIARTEATNVYAGATGASLQANGYGKVLYKPAAHVNCRCYIQPATMQDGTKIVVWYTARDELVCTKELDTPWGKVSGCRDLHRTIVSEGHAGEQWNGNLWNPEANDDSAVVA